jgi:hypothetical protein
MGDALRQANLRFHEYSDIFRQQPGRETQTESILLRTAGLPLF